MNDKMLEGGQKQKLCIAIQKSYVQRFTISNKHQLRSYYTKAFVTNPLHFQSIYLLKSEKILGTIPSHHMSQGKKNICYHFIVQIFGVGIKYVVHLHWVYECSSYGMKDTISGLDSYVELT